MWTSLGRAQRMSCSWRSAIRKAVVQLWPYKIVEPFKKSRGSSPESQVNSQKNQKNITLNFKPRPFQLLGKCRRLRSVRMTWGAHGVLLIRSNALELIQRVVSKLRSGEEEARLQNLKKKTLRRHIYLTSIWPTNARLVHQGTQRALDKGTVSKYFTWTWPSVVSPDQGQLHGSLFPPASETKSSSWVKVTLYKSPYSPGVGSPRTDERSVGSSAMVLFFNPEMHVFHRVPALVRMILNIQIQGHKTVARFKQTARVTLNEEEEEILQLMSGVCHNP